jgi:hypothetical protein
VNDTPAEREGDSAWARLRRRKVVQWGVVYVAAAWGFLQGLEYVSEAFHWPDQLRQIALLAMLIGLPIVLVVAYYHGDRGQQRISTSEFAILTLLLLLGGVLVLPAHKRGWQGRSSSGNHRQTGLTARTEGCTTVGRGTALREPEPPGGRCILR